MSTNEVNLREKIPFGIYRNSNLNHRFSLFHLPIQFEVTSCEKKPEIIGKIFDAVDISQNEITINQDKKKKYSYEDLHFYFDKIEGNLKFDGQVISKDNLIKELVYKEAKAEFSTLAFTILNNGKYLAHYFPDSLIGFFKQSEENFFMIDECLVNYATHKRFKFPSNPDHREKLESYIKQNYPGLSGMLNQLFLDPNEPALNSKNTTQRPT